ncbi:MAG: polyribonucleotide nucleotidyltransferase [Flavobacteriales bacterium]|nr:polyribonucleotide nucleotidyltransferase [Flavobacteriales bacterium]
MEVPQPKIQTITLADGRTITIETGVIAKQAAGSAIVRMGGTVLLGTVTTADEGKEGADFMPLTVEYKEQFPAAGRFPGGFMKREMRPNDEEILVARLIDRVLRPMFPSDYHAETQVVVQLLSYDGETLPDSLAGLAASAALAVSDIPFDGPISEVRVARVDGQIIINPTKTQLEGADIDLMVGATMDSIAMVEGEMKFVSEDEMVEAIAAAHEAIKVQVAAQIALSEQVPSSQVKRTYCHETHDEELREDVKKLYDAVYEVAKMGLGKSERSEKFAAIIDAYIAENIKEDDEDYDQKVLLAKLYYHDVEKEAVRNLILDEGIRLDGRKTTQIRPIWGAVNYLPMPHGSSVFTRGETQAMGTVTLGTSLDANEVDGVSFQYKQNFYLHYNFPPYCTGEAKPMRGVSRREIGHGNLAYRALKAVIPADCPYTVRVVSNVMESNGSSSMATVCAGTLALMDAGIQIVKPVSGIAMGLITDEKTGKYAILSDILGDEDHLGDMDFKVTGTEDGITACQMDIKIKGLSYEVLKNALAQARDGRMHILGKICEVIPEPRATVKDHAPKIESFIVPKDSIGGIIGTGGKVIQRIQAETGTTVTIEEVAEGGKVEILGTAPDGMAAAISMIKLIAFDPVIGEDYDVTVTDVRDFGAIVELGPNRDAMLHISELDWKRVDNAEEYVHVGDKIRVRLIEIDKEKGRLKVSLKALKEKPEGYTERPARPARPNNGGERRGFERRGGGNDRPRREGGVPRREGGDKAQK